MAISWFGRWTPRRSCASPRSSRTSSRCCASITANAPECAPRSTRARSPASKAVRNRPAGRLDAVRRMALAGYPIGLTIAPIIAADGWRGAYHEMIEDAAAALDGVPELDLTVELITHRFTAGSKAVLNRWYPGSALDMSEADRVTKRTKFGAEKLVYDAATMRALRSFFEERIALALPQARALTDMTIFFAADTHFDDHRTIDIQRRPFAHPPGTGEEPVPALERNRRTGGPGSDGSSRSPRSTVFEVGGSRRPSAVSFTFTLSICSRGRAILDASLQTITSPPTPTCDRAAVLVTKPCNCSMQTTSSTASVISARPSICPGQGRRGRDRRRRDLGGG
ncbi:spore photoproduct lyase family protein [Sphingomonas sp. MMS24-JH45]